MSTGTIVLLAGLILAVMSLAVSAAAKRPNATWNYYHFDGNGFVSGRPAEGGTFLAVRDGVLPAVLSRPTKIEALALPADKGVLAGCCYLQVSGGKQASGRNVAPCPGLALTIFSGESPLLRTQTDQSGHFVAVLPAGVFRVSSGAFSIEVTVEAGKTTLAALKAGKRMVD